MTTREISQAEYDDQIAWTEMLAREQRDIRRLRELVAEYPTEARKILSQIGKD